MAELLAEGGQIAVLGMGVVFATLILLVFAVKGMSGATKEIVERNGYTGKDLALFVPHQANIRIMEAAQRRIGLEDSQVAITIDRFGNTTAATIPGCRRPPP